MIVYLFIIFGLFMRLIPQLQHSELGALFSPILAIALFSGTYLSRKKALIIPLVIMLVSDYFIGYYNVGLMASVYGCFLLTTLWGKRNFLLGSLIAPIVYFIITNFTVWYFMDWYPKTLIGLYECFVMALPFFKNSIIGTLIYSGIFFGAYELSKKIIWITKKSFSYIPLR